MKQEEHRRRSITVSLDIKLIEEFDELCVKGSINRSRLVETFIREYVENNKLKEKIDD